MEGEEGDPERKMDIGRGHRQSERRQQTRQIGGDEIRIFEDREDEQTASAALRAEPSRSSMASAARKLKAIENRRTTMNWGSPQA
jgi:hypothetical protein